MPLLPLEGQKPGSPVIKGIATTRAPVHTRMPVILAEDDHAKWLGEIEDGNLKELLKPYPDDEMKMWPISQRVNSPKNDGPSLVVPIRV